MRNIRVLHASVDNEQRRPAANRHAPPLATGWGGDGSDPAGWSTIGVLPPMPGVQPTGIMGADVARTFLEANA